MISNHKQVFINMADKACLTPEKKPRLLDNIGRILAKKAADNARAKGGKRFWFDVADSVVHVVRGDSVIVGSSHHAGAFKHDGGVISAPGKFGKSPPRKYLSIPLPWCPSGKREAHLWPRDAIRFAKTRDGRRYMGVMEPTGGTISRGKNKGQPKMKFKALWALKKSVRIKPSPWWPTKPDVDAAIDKASRRLGGV